MRALVRPTSRRLADGQLTHIARVPVDVDLAERQWGEYCLVLDNWGFETVRVPGADDLPDSVFVEDTVVVFDGLAVVTSPGAETRRGETDAVADTLRGLATKGMALEVARIELPGTLDGGDVLKIGRTVYVGQGGRTNGDGIRQLRSLLTPRGYTVVGVPVTKVLHLKSAVTALPDGTVVGYPDDVDHPEMFERSLPMPEHGAAVVVLDAGTVLMAASVPASVALIESLGYRVITVDISEFEKLEGCVTCLSVRLRD
jgi:dimethylargininase